MASYFSSFNTSASSSSSDEDLTEINFDLANGDTQLLEIPEESTLFKTKINTGSITTYFFRIRPSLSESIQENATVSSSLVQNEYQYYSVYLNPGSTMQYNITITDGTSDRYNLEFGDFYIIQGQEDFSDFEDGYYFGYETHHYTSGETDLFTASAAEIYYIVFYITSLQYDTSGSVEIQNGEIDIDISNKDYSYAVIVGTSSTSFATGTVKMGDEQLSGLAIIGIILLVVVIVGSITAIVKKNQKKTGSGEYRISKKDGKQYKPREEKTPEKPKPTIGTIDTRNLQTLNENQVRKLRSMFKISRRVKVDDLARVLHVDRDDLLNYLVANPEIIEGFALSGDYFEAKGTSEDVDDFIDALDKQFEDWQGKEKTKSGKVESVNRFCDACGTRIDPVSLERLNATGKIFCTNCGKKITK